VCVAIFMHGLSVFVGLARFEANRFAADGTQRFAARTMGGQLIQHH